MEQRTASVRTAWLWMFVLLTASVAMTEAKPAADFLIVNARIYTVNASQPWAEALAIRGDRIVAVGTAKEIEAYRGPASRVIDAQKHLLLPGFTDSHIHFLEGAFTLEQVHLNDATTVAEIQQLVKSYAMAHPDEPWILGRGWTYPTFGANALPDKKLLDAIVPDRPVYLTCFDGHTRWANSKPTCCSPTACARRSRSDIPDGPGRSRPEVSCPVGRSPQTSDKSSHGLGSRARPGAPWHSFSPVAEFLRPWWHRSDGLAPA